jgi:hypothetical protein
MKRVLATGAILALLGLTAATLILVVPICWLLVVLTGLVRDRRWPHVWWELPGQAAIERQSLSRKPKADCHDERSRRVNLV